MQNRVNSIKTTLTEIITGMSESSMLFTKNPEKDFTRNRKLPFGTMLRMLISMGGNSITKELMDDQG